jgi:hypothetical protein
MTLKTQQNARRRCAQSSRKTHIFVPLHLIDTHIAKIRTAWLISLAQVCLIYPHNLKQDGTTPIKAFTTPELISKTISYPLTMWAQIVSFFGILCLFFMRNKQPMRTKNMYMIAGMVVAQLIHVRFALNQTFYDTCFLSNAIAVSMLCTEKWIILAQVLFISPY